MYSFLFLLLFLGSSVVNKALYHDTVVAVKMFFVVAGEHPQVQDKKQKHLLFFKFD